ncbi:hypothetical protein [Actinomadura rugatobispora]|uniref:Uncharacterized protein n=1 Tax=Actinomadura rugatobispora TaxID=1994 RepID=A0ABW1A2F8_9ACTN|nr:hypothetical protein GCM10010200_042360 [Actinomadura rugatobispora]
MSQTRSPSSSGAILAAVLVGLVAATIVDAVITVIISFMVNNLGYGGVGTVRVTAALTALIVGAIAGGVLLFTRPNGPLGPILAAVSSLVAVLVGDIIGIFVYHGVRGRGLPIEMVEIYFRSFRHMDLIGLVIFVLPPVVAGGLGAVRLMKEGGRQAQQPAPVGPWGGQQPQPPAPYGAQPGQYAQPGQPYPGQPAQPGPFGQPGQPGQPYPGQPAEPGQFGQPGGQPGQVGGQFAPPYDQGPGGSFQQPGQGSSQGEAPPGGGAQPPQGPPAG